MEGKTRIGMRNVWWITDSIISPLGLTSEENYYSVMSGKTGAAISTEFGARPVCLSQHSALVIQPDSTRFESMATLALKKLSEQISLPPDRTLFILSTTKGNIEVLEQDKPDHSRIHLHQVSKHLAHQVGIEKNIVVSNACTSGVVALLLAKRQIENGHYDHAIVLGADVVSQFVVSGFQCLNALSDSDCKPFDAARTGINLGEAASAVLISSQPDQFKTKNKVLIAGGAITNDANHISGPSKTGEELALAVNRTLEQSKTSTSEVDFISAHGTATLYNDEMEAKAFHLSGIQEIPLHSLKGNFGHTLGAAGVLESALSVRSLINQELIPSKGYTTTGVSKPLNIIRKTETRKMRNALKTSSGFGGCNAAILFQLES
jgi:3-oxoacyl-[acyl-carrier-protein] synthase-1